MGAKITSYELIQLIINKKIKDGTYINFYSKGALNYCIKYLYANDALWKTEGGIPDELMEVGTSILLDSDNLFEILPEGNDEWEDIEELNDDYYDENNDTISKHGRYVDTAEIVPIVNQLIKNQKYLKERLDKNE